MTFKIGDRVRVRTEKYEGNSVGRHYGMTGVIASQYSKNQWNVKWSVIRDDRLHMGSANATILYDEEDMEPEKLDHPMIQPEMELEEIHLAQNILQDLQKA